MDKMSQISSIPPTEGIIGCKTLELEEILIDKDYELAQLKQEEIKLVKQLNEEKNKLNESEKELAKVVEVLNDKKTELMSIQHEIKDFEIQQNKQMEKLDELRKEKDYLKNYEQELKDKFVMEINEMSDVFMQVALDILPENLSDAIKNAQKEYELLCQQLEQIDLELAKQQHQDYDDSCQIINDVIDVNTMTKQELVDYQNDNYQIDYKSLFLFEEEKQEDGKVIEVITIDD